MTWQKMDTAPTEGDDSPLILAWGNSSEDGGMIQVVFYNPNDGAGIYDASGNHYPGKDWCWSVVDGATFHKDRFTHWMPLPESPDGSPHG